MRGRVCDSWILAAVRVEMLRRQQGGGAPIPTLLLPQHPRTPLQQRWR